jgi:predicted TIM-barrel enzyme
MAIKSEFEVNPDSVILTTQTNGDRIDMRQVHLGGEAASNLATMINSGKVLIITIKEKPEV